MTEFHINADQEPPPETVELLAEVAKQIKERFRMKSVVIQIGNSDDKLTQKQWAAFVLRIRDCIERHDAQIHFWGASVNYEPWQNLCCVCEGNDAMYPMLSEITTIRKEFQQESVAVTIGGTEFI